jgi:nicotinamide-nucleotide amidase
MFSMPTEGLMAGGSPNVVLLALGDELIDGRLADGNGPWLARELRLIGCHVQGLRVASDRIGDICSALNRAAEDAPIVVCTGGLGPTSDDRTAEAAAAWAGVEVSLQAQALEWVEQRFASLNIPMAQANRKQAVLPEGSTAIENPRGTAPAFHLTHQGATAWFLPGVPSEMRALWADTLRPWLLERHALVPRQQRQLRCIGIAEATVQDRLAALELPEEVHLHYRASAPEIRLLLDAPGAFDAAHLDTLASTVQSAVGTSCLGIDTPPLEALVGELLSTRGDTIAVAESCTGGRICAALTSVPGASAYVMEGVCAYSNEAKVRTCGVPEALISTHGAVSEPVAIALAEGLRARASTTWGIGTTGIAGPSGGTPEKPIGLVHMALAWEGGSAHRALSLFGSRDRILHLTTHLAMDMLRRKLQDLPPTPPHR